MADPAPEASAPLAAVPSAAELPAEPWSPARRVAFRFVLCFAVLLYFPFPLKLIPFTDPASEWIGHGQIKASIWLADRLFHPPPEELPEKTGSGDILWNYVLMGANLALALVAAAAWTALDRRRTQHRTLGAWLDLYLRWSLFTVMAFYGFHKVFLHQMAWNANRLLEPLGDFSAHGLVWTFMGASAPYQAMAGWAEVLGGLMMIWRRTAGLGALLLLGVMGNVVAINFCYDVSAKLYSTQLWLTAALVVAPDARRLFRLLVLQRPTEPATQVPLVRSEWLRRNRWSTPALIVALAGWQVFTNVRVAQKIEEQRAERAAKAPLVGAYQVESFTPSASAKPEFFLAGPAWARVSGSLLSLGVLRADGSYFWVHAEPEADGSVKLVRLWTTESAVVHVEHPDAEHARIFGDGFEVKLKVIPASSFTFLRGFHWVQPMPVNR